MEFKKINNISGWIVFFISTVVYLITVERTASFWDCGEFIAVSYKLMVPHPPGAPLFLLIGRMFSFLAMGEVESVAYWINFSSVLASSFTILFLFWTITMLGRKALKITDIKTATSGQILALMGAGFIGSLAYCFSDSFWFSAVEAEVYAMSSFFTAFVVWAILKWELIEDESRANRWLVLIAYTVGLSIGVHLLNLVTIPALALVYYFKKFKVKPIGILMALAASGFIVILINNIIIPGLPSIAGSFDVVFVNSFGLPFGSGVIFVCFAIISAVVAGVYYSEKLNKVHLNTGMLALAFILIGYSCYTVVVIRSSYDPPIDENDPSDIMSFVSYLKREQYGYRPLMHGQYFTAEITGQKKGAKVYKRVGDKYEVVDQKVSYEYDKDHTTILPRIYSNSPQHQQRYREILNLSQGEKPSFIDNLTFMAKHQLGWMYFRYFLWNFAGRESDIQDANWMSISDAFEEVPEELANNKGRNNFFMLPLILGLLGLVFHMVRDKKGFAFNAMLFFLTGIALILYLNSPPIEPRERDYIYVGSFYAFAIWIGFGVLALASYVNKVLSVKTALIATSLSLVVPVIMAAEGWDDHNRNNRYFSVDSAKNFLASCAPNAVIFTGGDNDTFPLWYVQNVEGFRTDVRVLVLSYTNTDWYIKQMTQQQYESDPLPMTLSLDNYKQGGLNDMLPYYDLGLKGALNAKGFLDMLKNNDKRLRVYQSANAIPAKTISLSVDVKDVLDKQFVPKAYDSLLQSKMVFNMKGSHLEKKDLLILDFIATNNWERPVYFNNTSLSQVNFNFRDYCIQEGQAYRLLPVKNPTPNQTEFVNTSVMFDNMMNNFYYRELDNPKANLNEDYRGFITNHRSSFNTLVAALIQEGKMEKARQAMLFNLEKMPDTATPYDFSTSRSIDLLFQLGEKEKAIELANIMAPRADQMLAYLIEKKDFSIELRRNLVILNEIQTTLHKYGENELAKQYEDILNTHYADVQLNTGGLR